MGYFRLWLVGLGRGLRVGSKVGVGGCGREIV